MSRCKRVARSGTSRQPSSIWFQFKATSEKNFRAPIRAITFALIRRSWCAPWPMAARAFTFAGIIEPRFPRFGERCVTDEEILRALPDLSALVIGDICLDRWCKYDPNLALASAETGIPRTAVVSDVCTPGAGGTVAANLRALG